MPIDPDEFNSTPFASPGGVPDETAPDVDAMIQPPTHGNGPFSSPGGIVDSTYDETQSCGVDFMERGTRWLSRKFQANATQPVVYQYDSTKVKLCVRPGRRLMKTTDDDGNIRMTYTDRDFVFPAADLVVRGEVREPKRGNMVRDYDREAERTLVYEVLPNVDNVTWQWCDAYRVDIRVFTKFIRTETP